jgi:capsid protein
VNNIVGAGIRPRAATGTDALDNRINELWEAWAARSDADGLADFHGLTTLAVREMIEGGDVFLRRRIRRTEDKLPVPVRVESLQSLRRIMSYLSYLTKEPCQPPSLYAPGQVWPLGKIVWPGT